MSYQLYRHSEFILAKVLLLCAIFTARHFLLFLQSHSQLQVQFNILQDEYGSARAQLDEEAEAASSFKLSSQKWQADFQQLKSKYDKDILTSHDELEETRSVGHLQKVTMNWRKLGQ